ncbi:MAG: 6-phosphofructokinase [Bacilli bacterium]|jgi:6-phosphofructokinase 1|nr:6-phosphofructokinase [Bacilli bacterium]
MKKIAILTSGGDAPGMNAAIRGAVRAALFENYEIIGILDGFKGLYNNEFIQLSHRSVSEKLSSGGTFLGTSRFDLFFHEDNVKRAAENIEGLGIDYLIVIGGEGSYQGAYALYKQGVKVLCLPGTIDNDIASTKYTIGYDTAVNTVVEAIDKIKDSSNSHNRCSIIEVMGRKCGDIALESGVSTGAEAIITNIDQFNYDEVVNVVKEGALAKKRNTIIVITEHICNVVDLAKYVEEKTGVETRAQILGYIQRGGTPTAMDRFIGSGLGAEAISLIKQDVYNVCLGTNGFEFYFTNINEALQATKYENEYLNYLKEALK